jgi:hypothetical protein
MTKKYHCLLLCLVLAADLCSCASQPENHAVNGESRTLARQLIRTEPESAPEWKDILPQNPDEIFFVGLSRSFGSAAEARNDARENAFNQIMRFYGEFIRSSAMEKSSINGSSAEVIAALVNREEEIMHFAQAVVSQVGTDRYYTEVYLNAQNQEAYVVYALCQIPRQKAEQDIADFAQNTSERYGSLLDSRHGTLAAALLVYGEVLSALEQNPLHRAVAYYDGPAGRTGLYDYCRVQLNTLAASVSFAPLPKADLQRGQTLTRTVTLSSGMFPEIGPLSCRVEIIGHHNESPAVEYHLERDNSFTLRLLTPRLEAGTYTVRLELPLNAITPAIRQNPHAAFALDVRPAEADIRFEGGTLSASEQRVFSQTVRQALQNHQVPLLAGYVFVIDFNIKTQTEPVTSTSLLLCDISVNLTSADGILLQSPSGHITDISRDYTVKLAADYITGNSTFWTEVAEFMRR